MLELCLSAVEHARKPSVYPGVELGIASEPGGIHRVPKGVRRPARVAERVCKSRPVFRAKASFEFGTETLEFLNFGFDRFALDGVLS
jgi:hypothetical protein